MALDTARTSSDSVADHVSDHNTLHSDYNEFHTDRGYQHVDPSGADSNDGRSWAAPKATVAAAVGELTSGGKVLLSGDDHTIASNIDLTQSIVFVGAGRGLTRLVIADGVVGFTINDTRNCGFQDLQFRPDDPAATGVGGLEITGGNAEYASLNRVWFMNIGKDVTSDLEAEDANAPFAVKVDNSTAATSDFHSFHDFVIWNCYRGLALMNGSDGFISNFVIRSTTGGAATYIERDDAPVGWTIANGQIVQSANVSSKTHRDAGYLIYMRSAHSTNKSTNVSFENIKTEISESGFGDVSHVYCNTEGNWFGIKQYIGGGTSGDGPSAIFFDSDAADNRVGPYRTVGQGGNAAPVFDGPTVASQTIWQPSDYTG